ncbi:glycosyltransferase [Selenomonas ruminantium]|uniref:Glycosyltransferase, GT2 family n=1 Tax=Selenomonas ruminantium TaxID=971 RepID=A0A1H0RI40_SELRU|nr:glycosyltransferase [Selenomonas ruminantium]SDP29232.1 Glycosyltransferase, GT2 family [Selenomonas ruminantium]
MRSLQEWMTEFVRREREYDFPGMAECLAEARNELYREQERSAPGKLFLDKFLNVFVLSAFVALEAGNGQQALVYLEMAEEVLKKIYDKQLLIMKAYKGYALQAMGDFDKAEKLYLEYLAYEPRDETIFLRLGNMAVQQKQWDKGLEAYGHALQIKKNYREAMINIGVVARMMGDEDTAASMAQTEEMRQRIFGEGSLEENPCRYALEIDDDDFRNIPIFINARDRLTCLRQQIDWLWQADYHNIYILDNASTYPPLLAYYDEIKERIKVLYLKQNLGYKALWKSGVLNVLNIQTPYVYTDPDIVPVEECPYDVLKKMLQVLRKHPYIKKVGFGLRTDDITFAGKAAVLASEGERMMTELAPDVYFGVIDTTFALYRNLRHYNAYATLRLAGKYMARHLPWYMDYQKLSADEDYYAKHATEDYSTLKVLKDNGMVKEQTLTSIIILSYNALDYTKLCLESIRKNTEKGTYEIIVVDNGSKDGSAQWLATQTDICCIFNKKNMGFPKGCNQGMEIAQGTELLLLNNDTVVTPGWLDNMRKALYSGQNIGAVGCMTNHCSNEQAIRLPYQSIEELMAVAGNFNRSDAQKWYPWMVLVGFCLLMKREVYMRLGNLDESFSPGNFEDDDYCLRMRKAGYELLLCGDTYIHHFGSVAFAGKNDAAREKDKKERYNKLIEKNRAYFMKKWSIKGTYRSHYEMTDLLYKELSPGQDVLLVNCDMGYELFWLKRRIPEATIYGLTSDKLGVELAGKTFPLYVCHDFLDGLDKHYQQKKFARIALLGNYHERRQGDKLIQTLRQHLTEDGLLFFGDQDRVYRMPFRD